MRYLQWLAAMVLLTVLGAVPYVIERTLRIGLLRTLGNPATNLALFAPALIAAHLAPPQAHLLAAAQVNFFARLAHSTVHAAGVPVWRTLAYLAGIGATLAVQLN